MINETEQTNYINNLIHSIDVDMILGDFKDNNDMINHITNKVNAEANNAANWGYIDAKIIAEEISLRVGRLANTRKQHKVSDRIKEIITSIKY